MLCALKLQSNFKYITPKFDKSIRDLKLGITQGKSKKSKILATRMCEVVVNDKFVISEEVKVAYNQENNNKFISREGIKILKLKEEMFLSLSHEPPGKLFGNNPDFQVSEFSHKLSLSNSQFYRKLKQLTGKSPSTFLRDFRLNRAFGNATL